MTVISVHSLLKHSVSLNNDNNERVRKRNNESKKKRQYELTAREAWREQKRMVFNVVKPFYGIHSLCTHIPLSLRIDNIIEVKME